MHTEQYQLNQQNQNINIYNDDHNIINIFNDSINDFDLINSKNNELNNELKNELNNDNENNFINESNQLIDPIEQLLMSSDVSPLSHSDFNDDIYDPNQLNNYLQNDLFNQSPTYDSYFNDNELIYPSELDLEKCNSLHDYSSISNIMYTNKIKDKLRKNRYLSSTDLSISNSTTTINNSAKIMKNCSSNNLASFQKRTKLRSKSAGAILSHKHVPITKSDFNFSTFSGLTSQSRSTSPPILTTTTTSSSSSSSSSIPTSIQLSPNSKASNPFYKPPEILKHLSNA